MKNFTYKKSGVDINAATLFKNKIRPLVRKSFRPEVLQDIGGFGSFFRLAKANYKDLILVSSADGVGTKLSIASLVNKHDTVGIDAVAMNVNDILCVGAEPLFFLDYIAYSKVSERCLVDLVKGINEGCIESGCSLIGGETAQMPDIYKNQEYDIAGFCVGAVERKRIIDGSKIKPGNLVLGLESSGLHSNGFSLVRKVFSQQEIIHLSKDLLVPTRIYVKPVLSLLPDNDIKGIAHITGGAFYDKILRILPDNVHVRINKGSWPIPELFRLIQDKGGIADKEMFHTLNMGIGMVLVIERASVKAIQSKLKRFKLRSWIIGEVVKGKKEVEVV